MGGQVRICFGGFQILSGPVKVAHGSGGGVDIIFADESRGQSWEGLLKSGYECGLDESRFARGKEHTLPKEAKGMVVWLDWVGVVGCVSRYWLGDCRYGEGGYGP